MAESRSESGSEEELPSLSSLLELHKLSPPRPLSPDPEVVVVSSGGEEAEEVVLEEVAALRGRGAARGGAGSEPCWQPDGGLCASGDLVAPGSEGPWGDPVPSGGGCWGGENSVCGAEGPALPVGQDKPSSPLVSRASTEASPPPKKKRQYSQREREAVCQAAWERRKEREAKRRLQEEEKERKRALAKTLKAQRPGECQKYITVVLDPVLLQVEGGEQILRALEAANYSCVVENQAVPCSITWRRKTVSSQKVDSCTEGQKMTLQSYVAHVMEKLPGKILALAVVGVENYFRSLGVQSKQRLQQAAVPGNQEEQRKGRKRKINDSGLELTRMDMEEALVDLQLCTQVQVSFFDSCEELGEYATMFTKAVAEAPFKREREDTGFSFYLEKRWCGGVKVDHSGKGLLKVWNRQIQQFNRVSPAMAEAIVSAYPSPQLLIQAYGKCSSDQERENMLANIPVHRGEGVTATSRRIGPELSRRIYLQMTSHNPDLCLDFTG
ncbi:crossover junction endonuclease EME1 isoform X2 [Chiroxiphia lanceolata]|uniref:crossover junction endonuclease EME1 isoform X2 n=1 Tax=Chiroxiphia lanceolata TaxID=296741 RepID=UPI0013CE54FA|nr:crossover junction endonuclease EME1 isoform X2 [Chiroxiphia lanceolata]